MTEEEKKALKYLRKNVIARIDIDKNGKEKIIGYGNAHKYIILKLIKKQQKEIKELKEKNKKMFIQYEKRVNELEREIAINSISKDEIRERITQLELLDKQYYKKVIVVLEKILEEN